MSEFEFQEFCIIKKTVITKLLTKIYIHATYNIRINNILSCSRYFTIQVFIILFYCIIYFIYYYLLFILFYYSFILFYYFKVVNYISPPKKSIIKWMKY